MRTAVAVVLVVLALDISPTMLAQGLVNFFNDSSTPVYAQALQTGGAVSIMSLLLNILETNEE